MVMIVVSVLLSTNCSPRGEDSSGDRSYDVRDN